MDRLLTTLAGLVVGLRGTRRAALDEIVFLLREEWDILRRTLDSMDDMAARRIEELNVALKDLVDERAEVDRLRNHLAVLREENGRLLGQMLRQGMELDAANETLRNREAHIRALAAGGHTLTVKRRLLKDYKIACIKAGPLFRHVAQGRQGACGGAGDRAGRVDRARAEPGCAQSGAGAGGPDHRHGQFSVSGATNAFLPGERAVRLRKENPMNTSSIIAQAESEHGPIHMWDEPWYQDDMYVPFDDGEIAALGLERDEVGFLRSQGIDLPLEIEDWDNYHEPQRRAALTVPSGTVVWMECNHPGRVYISGRDWFDWSDFNGYMPAEISGAEAMALIAEGEDGEPWNLEVCGPLPAECVAEMAKARRGDADL